MSGQYERSGRDTGDSIFGWFGVNFPTTLHNANVRFMLRAPVGGVVGVLPLLAGIGDAGRLIVVPPNKALQLTARSLRALSAAELGR